MTRSRQTGIALITALLVVAVAATAATAMVSRQQVDIRRSQNILARDQAYAYALAAETFALAILHSDDDMQKDHLQELWAQPALPMTFEGASISMRIYDLQGRFNLNNLVKPDGSPNDKEIVRFQNLLHLLGLNTAIANAVLDWIDQNQDPRYPGGAEDDVYTRKERPYRPPNALMRSVTELRMVEHVDAEAYNLLEPLVTALPEPTPINVNTASAETLASLAQGVTLSEAESLIKKRPEEGWDVNTFLQDPVYAGRAPDQQTVSATSNYFLLRGTVDLGRSRAELTSIVKRSSQGQVEVVARGSRVL